MEQVIHFIFTLAIIALVLVAVAFFLLVRRRNSGSDNDETDVGSPEDSAFDGGSKANRKKPAWADNLTATNFPHDPSREARR